MNNFFSADLIFIIMVAAFLILRLRSVLGKRTGNEKKGQNSFTFDVKSVGKDLTDKKIIEKSKEENSFVKESSNIKSGEAKTNFEKIYELDKTFSTKEFLKGAQKAFETIVMNYSKGNLKKIKNLLDQNTLKTFSNAVNQRTKKKQVLDHTLISFKSAEIKKISFRETIANIIVQFVTEQVNLLKNEKGKVIEGNNDYIEKHVDNWTFSKDLKSSDPNWKLVFTETGKQ